MPPKISYSKKAQADIAAIFAYYLQHTNNATAQRNVAQLYEEIEDIAAMPLSSPQVPNMEVKYRHRNVLKATYKVYYKTRSPGLIRILRVWPTRRRPLRPNEVE